MSFLNKVFKLDVLGAKVSTEVLAGLTTFLTMSYIIAINPIILSDAGMDKGSVFIATIIIAASSCIFMGLYANWPVVLAPGMGLNAFFTYSVVLSLGFSWQISLFAVFVSGIIFLLISVTSLRTLVVRAIPDNLKAGIGVGVGLFIAYIGLQNSGLVVGSEVTVSSIGDLSQPAVFLSCAGFLLIIFLEALKVRGSLLISIVLLTITSFFVTDNQFGGIIGKIPEFKTFLALDFNFASLFNTSFLVVVLSLLFVDFFDSTGTLIAISHSIKDREGGDRLDITKNSRPLIVDSVATVVGSLLGTSTATSYVESVTGVKAGGKTGLTACVVGVLFLASLFFFPIVNVIPPYATAPALIYVGFLFLQNLKTIDFSNIFELIPAGVAALTIPFTFSISHGIVFGFISYVVIQLGLGRFQKISKMVWVVFLIGVAYLFVH